jgi:hypothetical protein
MWGERKGGRKRRKIAGIGRVGSPGAPGARLFRVLLREGGLLC